MISSGVYAAIPPPCDQVHGCPSVPPPSPGPAITTTTTTQATSAQTTTTAPGPSACGLTGCPLFNVGFQALSSLTGLPISGAHFTVTGADGAPAYYCCGFADSSGTWSTQKYGGLYSYSAAAAGYATQVSSATISGPATFTVTLSPASTTSVYPYGLPQTLTSSYNGVTITWTLLKATDALCVLGGQSPGCGAFSGGSTSHLMTLYQPSPNVGSCGWNQQQGACIQVGSTTCWQVGATAGQGTACFAGWAPFAMWGSGASAGTGVFNGSPTMYATVGYYPETQVVASVFLFLASALSPASSLPLVGGGSTPAAILIMLGIVPLAVAYMIWKRK